MKKLSAWLLVVFATISCEHIDPGPVIIQADRTTFEDIGIYVLNEGNFGRGNGSVSFYSRDSGLVYNNVFLTANSRAPGDLPFSLIIKGDTGYLVVNNSGKIEVLDINTMKSLKTITGMVSPRYILPVSNNTGYVSDLYSDSLAILDLKSCNISGYINIGKSSEMMVKAGSKVYVASWSGENAITVIDSYNNSVLDVLQVVLEPESMVIDKNSTLWVLCSGGFMKEEVPALVKINTMTDVITHQIEFPPESYPTSLRINSSRDSLYFLDRGVYKMCIDDSVIPVEAFINPGQRLFYKIEPDRYSGDVFVTDANDYQRNGFILHYLSDGSLKDVFETGVIPGSIYHTNVQSDEK